jgi:hypothetical protein
LLHLRDRGLGKRDAETFGRLAIPRGDASVIREIVAVQAEELELGNVPEEPVRRTDQKQGVFRYLANHLPK